MSYILAVPTGGTLSAMNTFTLGLWFKESPKGAPPGPPTSWVCVKSYTGGVENWPPLLTPVCVNPAEIDYHIDQLKDELEIVRREAHKRYAGYDGKLK